MSRKDKIKGLEQQPGKSTFFKNAFFVNYRVRISYTYN